ncbi:carbohydrate binding domain-containing protein [Streptomyces sp. NPDC102462]|uniref:carbohydrate binding domain-containing protein n=1 Tax=Streptomyces sp. NPDC102462 TaxID=3366178 RepID=UPI003825C0CF
MSLVVEMGWGGLVQAPETITWTDITPYVDVSKSGVTITRGAADEQAETQPGTATLFLDNEDGRFTAGNAASPYYPFVRRNAPIRIQVVTTAKNFVTNPNFADTAGWELGSDASTSFALSMVRAQFGTQSLLVTWGGTFNNNPTFEVDASSWSGNTGTIARVSTQAHSGSWSLQVTPNGTSPSPRAESEKFPLSAGSTFRAQGWMRCVSSRRVGLNVNWYDASGTFMSTSFNIQNIVANTWTFYSGTFTPPAGAAFAQLAPTVHDTPPVTDLMFVDDVRFLASPGTEFPAVGTTLRGLTIGRQYTASAYVWVPAGSRPVCLFVVGIDNAGSPSTTVDAWQRITYTFTATSTSHTLQLIPTGNPQFGRQVWLDAVQVEEGGTATAFDGRGARVHDRFWGMVNEWPVGWEGLVSTVQITCTDLFKRLNKLPALRSMLAEEILVQAPMVYYPLSEDSTSNSAGDIGGNGAPSLAITQAGAGGTLTLATAAGPPETGEQTPVFTPSTATAGKWLSADLGPQYEGTFYRCYEAFFQTTTTGRCILGIHSTDLVYQHLLSIGPGGNLQIEWTSDQTTTMTTETVSGPTTLADGNWHHVVYDQREGKVWIDGVLVDSTLAVPRGFNQRVLHVGGYRGTRLWSGSIAHAVVYQTDTTSAGPTAATHYDAGMTGHAGETADVRIQRLASYTGIPSVTLWGSTFDPIASQGPGGSSVVARMREVESTESARLFAERDWYGLAFQSRDIRYNPDPASEIFTIDYADLETRSVELADDDQKLINSLDASRPGGATQRVTSPESIRNNGIYDPGVLSILKTSDNKVLDAANWRVSRYADPAPELREVPIEAYTMPYYADILDAEISNYFTVFNMPPQSPAPAMRVTVEGYTETIKEASHLIQFHCSSSLTDSVWVLDDPVYSVLDTSTRLAY